MDRRRQVQDTPVLEDYTYINPISPSTNAMYLLETPYQNRLQDDTNISHVQQTEPNTNYNHSPSLNPNGIYQPLTTTPRATHNIIRVINKDMTDQFRGRSHSVPQAKIRWFENRKSQLLGFCLTMAFFGISIALYSYRWIGLIAGSVNTIICGSAVVLTYFRKKHWHQHPNPIVHIRAILGIFFAVFLLLNVWVKYDPAGNGENCQRLAGVTEFFFFTSEAWGLVMACDLFFSVSVDTYI
jgi:hypothetical protein